MATYDYKSWQLYQLQPPNNMNFLSVGPASDDDGTITDLSTDAVFSFGEYVQASNTIDGPFVGVINEGGQQFFAISKPAVGVFLFSTNDVAATDFPSGFAISDLVMEALPECFAAGTLIAAETREIPVEQLQIGDLIRRAI